LFKAMIKFRIGFLGTEGDIAILIEHPEFDFSAPVLWFGKWEDFESFRDMVEEFYIRAAKFAKSDIPDAFLLAFNGEE
jgi:hypothetical protein